VKGCGKMGDPPTPSQTLGAQIRAEEERWTKTHRKPYKGGWLIPPKAERDMHLSQMFGLTPHEVSLFLTYSRYCTHRWSDGACVRCP